MLWCCGVGGGGVLWVLVVWLRGVGVEWLGVGN